MTQAQHNLSASPIEKLASAGSRAEMQLTLRVYILFYGLANAAAALCLSLYGRPLLPERASLHLWSNGLGAAANSQHLSDPYSFMHAVFGAGLYLLLHAVKPGWRKHSKFFVAVLSSVVWEIIENSAPVIRMFGHDHQPSTYAGDTIINSLSDIGFATAGFFLAGWLGWRATIMVALVVEISLSATIGDGFLLGVWKAVQGF